MALWFEKLNCSGRTLYKGDDHLINHRFFQEKSCLNALSFKEYILTNL
jgi:hypothetical protein